MMNFLPRRRAPRAFTLIELMVVIGIIALLAALVAYLLPGVSRKNKIARVTTEMRGLEAVINQYKSRTGFYPPDNTNNNNGHALPPLFYEIKALDPTSGEARDLGISGIANAGEIRQDFFPTLKSSGFATNESLPNRPVILTVPVEGPAKWSFQGTGGNGRQGSHHPWHYNSHAPEHNIESYDLWAEIEINGDKVIIGNWKD